MPTIVGGSMKLQLVHACKVLFYIHRTSISYNMPNKTY